MRGYLEPQATRLVGSTASVTVPLVVVGELFRRCVSDQHKRGGFKNAFLSTLSWVRSPSPASLGPVQVLANVAWEQVKVTQLLCKFIGSVVPKPLASLPVLTGSLPSAPGGL